MSFLAGMVFGGLLGAYWTRPGGWLGTLHGHYRQAPYYPAQYYYPTQYSYPASYYPMQPRPLWYYGYPQYY